MLGHFTALFMKELTDHSHSILASTSAFNLHELCDEALSHYSRQAAALLILTGALQI